jgi:excisionase family DNA binding protein
MPAQHRLLTVGETALILRQSERSVRDKIARGEIPSLRVGVGPRAPIRIDADELERWLYRPLVSSPKPAARGATSPIAGSPQPFKTKTIT